MAKAVIPLHVWRDREGTTRDQAIEKRLRQLFTIELAGAGEESEVRAAARGSE